PADANAGGDITIYCRMFHWGENNGFNTDHSDGLPRGNIRTVANLDWSGVEDPELECNGGAWQMIGSKMSLSECDGKLYFLWVQFNDLPNGIGGDCAERAWAGDAVGAANGELYFAISSDYGITWDGARNLTNSRTPNCDSASGTGGRCESDHWPSMNRIGTNTECANISGTEIVDPTGEYTGGYYLDVQYISDPDAGGIVQDEGSWQVADVKWFRLACVEPEPTALFNPSWSSIAFPAWCKHGEWIDSTLVIENSGNVTLNATVTVTMDPPYASGWLTTDFGGSISIPSGTGNVISGTVSLNAGGYIDDAGTIVNLTGDITFTGNQVGSPNVMPISFFVVDTLIPPEFDTLFTPSLCLVVCNNGNWGNQGAGHVNLDYFDYGDCDNAEEGSDGDTLPGDATIYMYDASPVICWTEGETVNCNYSCFGQGYTSDHGFFPMSHISPTDMGNYDMYKSEFVTRDTGIMIEKTWIAPNDPAQFIIQILKIYVLDGETHDGLAIGEGMDWDIPADSGSWNRSGFNAENRLMYQIGSEFDQDDAYECMDNSDRAGGLALLEIYENGDASTEFHGVYTEDNSTQVYPFEHFNNDSIYTHMGANTGYVAEADSIDADLHMVFTFRYDYTLTPIDTLVIYKVALTTYDGGTADMVTTAELAHAYYEDHIKPPVLGCCIIPADINYDQDPTSPNIVDMVYLVNFMFNAGPPPPCMPAADVNGDGDPTSPNIVDMVYLVNFMFNAGPAPPPCL
ncbi:MAG: hypothetical protein U9R56_02975, partial [candidate division Zixibacteria bacterium]|nr:hypothetical protein [candidate division Zixibacteria bacterium]